MLASTLNIEEKEVLNVIEAYSNALTLLDDYDHGTIPKPDGIASVYKLTYEECREMIDSMKYGNDSDVFGVEKELGKLNGIIAAVYQNVFKTELYPSIEEKAANLLYFLIKDHPFVDGCKRIGASIFLEFLNMSIPRWRSHPIHENRATESIWTEPCNPLLRATKSTKRATSA